jgi:histidine triad (HIT) family protein
MAYDPTNIFAASFAADPLPQGLRGRQHLAFMDIMPQSAGHTLVIPKTPGRTS